MKARSHGGKLAENTTKSRKAYLCFFRASLTLLHNAMVLQDIRLRCGEDKHAKSARFLLEGFSTDFAMSSREVLGEIDRRSTSLPHWLSSTCNLTSRLNVVITDGVGKKVVP